MSIWRQIKETRRQNSYLHLRGNKLTPIGFPAYTYRQWSVHRRQFVDPLSRTARTSSGTFHSSLSSMSRARAQSVALPLVRHSGASLQALS